MNDTDPTCPRRHCHFPVCCPCLNVISITLLSASWGGLIRTAFLTWVASIFEHGRGVEGGILKGIRKKKDAVMSHICKVVV